MQDIPVNMNPIVPGKLIGMLSMSILLFSKWTISYFFIIILWLFIGRLFFCEFSTNRLEILTQ